jgi:hypothetical protein
MSLRNITATVRRLSAQTTWVDGLSVDSAEDTPFSINCSVQPLTPKEMEMLPEGRRNEEVFRLYTDTELHTVEDKNPDKIDVLGDTYEVLSVARWRNSIIPHYKAIIVKQ